MGEQKQTESEEAFETRTYDEIARDIEANKGSSEKQTETPPAGAAEVDEVDSAGEEETTDDTGSTDDSSQLDTEEPQTLEEAKALLAKVRKEAANAQSVLGRQGSELGEIRKEIAALRNSKQAEETKVEFNSYVELFDKDEAFKGMNGESRKYLGLMFDRLEDRLLKRVGQAPEISKLRSVAEQTEINEVQSKWEGEAKQLLNTYGKELMDKHGPEIARTLEGLVKQGLDPKEISVVKVFRELAFDDIAAGRFKKTDVNATAKDELNKRAGPKKTVRAPAVKASRDYTKLDNKEAFRAMLKEDGIGS